jgi:hypothetical protein
MVRCSNPCFAEVDLRVQKQLPHNSAQHRDLPQFDQDTLTRSSQMCQNSNEFCRENNSFAKLSQHKTRANVWVFPISPLIICQSSKNLSIL